ncbi:MAG: rRNA maturation RNase YbeY [Peptococcaceae bacterium]|nr:rRNA maturation RNase YbeY [Peptococcaceae bacterium]
MEMDINWQETSVSEAEQQELCKLLREGISLALDIGDGPENAEIGLLLVDNDTIRDLNKAYRGVDAPTDVLSFALREKGEGEPDILFNSVLDEDPVLGDIVISVERARAQAEEFGHSFRREMVYLAVHGVLHLLGFDHERAEEAAIMRSKEEEVMIRLGLPR